MPETAIAAVAVSPGVMEIQEITIPPIGDDEALLRIEASGICGTDYEWFRGDLPISYPVILGHEPLGTIEVIGPEASRAWGVKVGDRVAVRSPRCGKCQACQAGVVDPCLNSIRFGATALDRPPGLSGGHAEYMCLPAGTVVYPMDKKLPAGVAVMLNPLGAGFDWAVEAPGLKEGESIAILGPGQRGLCAVVAAKEAGASTVVMTGIDRDENKLALARDLGANLTVNVDQHDPVDRVMEATGGIGVDVVLDAAPYSVLAVAQAIRMVKTGGRVVLAGLKGGRPLADLSSDEIVWKRITVIGVRAVRANAFERAVEAIHSGRYPLERLHTHSFPVEETEQALKTLAGETGDAAIHIAITPRSR